MNLALTSMRQWAMHGLAALGVLAAVSTGSAHAGNVGISVGIHVPGAPVYVMPPPHHHKKAYKQYRKEYKRYHKHHYRDYDDD